LARNTGSIRWGQSGGLLSYAEIKKQRYGFETGCRENRDRIRLLYTAVI
jgi:hypothetical protein